MAMARGCLKLRALRGCYFSEFLHSPTICVSQLTGHPLSQFFTTAKRSTLSSAIISKAKRLNAKYEQFLERNFPRFYVIYSTFFRGFRLLYFDFKEVSGIKRKMAEQALKYNQLPYREMEKLRQFRRDIIKVMPVVLLSLPPFANYMVFILMYFFPRQLLIRHFWTRDQQQEFMEIYHSTRAQVYPNALRNLTKAASKVPDRRLKNKLLQLSNKVEEGIHPEISQLQLVAKLFSGHPLDVRHIGARQMKILSQVMFLTPHMPTFIIRHRLQSHIIEIHHLDQALNVLGVHNLSEDELKIACYTRGLNSVHLNAAQCKEWLTKWIQLSKKLRDSEASLLLYSMVLLSSNYHNSRKSK
ncbi:LETM1 domain-containing protein 1 isoform X1 [Scyliorhinus canicula]|uniref:LETM1 domain-containing protein 1 isoform X1 n=2 Tax=Scyliorhinus canicula TaxID=7830 RepID=UPI0018F63D72|nr:LETM1 domain-containing protein 1 isoform X1 [Scyliorhinus canicula]